MNVRLCTALSFFAVFWADLEQTLESERVTVK
jgi:hypothetical protein